MNVCKDCKFYRRNFFAWLKRSPAKCSHYGNVNPITGEPSITCGDYCGIMGRFFETKKPVTLPLVVVDADVGFK